MIKCKNSLRFNKYSISGKINISLCAGYRKRKLRHCQPRTPISTTPTGARLRNLKYSNFIWPAIARHFHLFNAKKLTKNFHPKFIATSWNYIVFFFKTSFLAGASPASFGPAHLAGALRSQPIGGVVSTPYMYI